MKNKKIIYIGLFFIIIVGIASSIHTIQNKPENIIKKFVKAIENKDGNLLCSCLLYTSNLTDTALHTVHSLCTCLYHIQALRALYHTTLHWSDRNRRTCYSLYISRYQLSVVCKMP